MKYNSYRDNSDKLVVAIEGMPSLTYKFVSWNIKRKFGLKKSSEFTSTIEEQFQEYMKDGNRVSLDWDVWSGFTVTALTGESESLVQEVGDWLKIKYCL
jgi:hypothetical protein